MSCGEYAPDELLEDDYYKSEFERRVQERKEEKHSAILNVGIRENGDSTLYEINQFKKISDTRRLAGQL